MGLVHDGPFPVVEAGVYPPELVYACSTWGVTPAELRDWAVKRYEVVMILASGQKVSVSVQGDWKRVAEDHPVDGEELPAKLAGAARRPPRSAKR